jgi:hypothetical protein
MDAFKPNSNLECPYLPSKDHLRPQILLPPPPTKLATSTVYLFLLYQFLYALHPTLFPAETAQLASEINAALIPDTQTEMTEALLLP